MQLLGQNIEPHFVQPFALHRPNGTTLLFQVSPLPLGFQSRLRKRGVIPPTPPLKISRDSAGRPIREPNGLAVTHIEQNNAEYLQSLELYHQRVAVLAIVESLRNDPTVLFETPLPNEKTSPSTGWEEFADAIFLELERAGLTIGDLIAFCDEICKISNLLDQHIQETRTNFSVPLRESFT